MLSRVVTKAAIAPETPLPPQTTRGSQIAVGSASSADGVHRLFDVRGIGADERSRTNGAHLPWGAAMGNEGLCVFIVKTACAAFGALSLAIMDLSNRGAIAP